MEGPQIPIIVASEDANPFVSFKYFIAPMDK